MGDILLGVIKMRAKKKVSLHDIAQEAGVSIATVSRVINRKNSVKPATRDRILSILAESDYPLVEETAVAEESSTIAVFVPDFANPFTSIVLDGIRKSAKLNRYNTVMMVAKEANDHTLSDYLNLIRDVKVKGIISLAALPNESVIQGLNQEIPLVMCSEYVDSKNVTYVSVDNHKAAYDATTYLIQSGRRHIVHFNSTLNHQYARERESGYRAALTDFDLPIDDSLILHLPRINYQLALSQIQFLLENQPDIDGVFASSDIFAAAAVEAALKTGRHVPQDIAIIGFDDIEIATIITPKLTTVHQPSFELGFQACELLKDKIRNPQQSEKQILLYTNLVIRETTSVNPTV